MLVLVLFWPSLFLGDLITPSLPWFLSPLHAPPPSDLEAKDGEITLIFNKADFVK